MLYESLSQPQLPKIKEDTKATNQSDSASNDSKVSDKKNKLKKLTRKVSIGQDL